MKNFLICNSFVLTFVGVLGCSNIGHRSDVTDLSTDDKQSLQRRLATENEDKETVEIENPQHANENVKSNDNFVLIKAGSFMMGTPATEKDRYDDEILHEVEISHDFEIQATVVTQAQFYLVMGYNPSLGGCTPDTIKKRGIAPCRLYPVEQVTWFEAQKFIEKLNDSDNEYTYRLPTEAELEYAIRAGSKTAYWFGDDVDQLGHYACYFENWKFFKKRKVNCTPSVIARPRNPWGLYDANGRINQWTSDWYGEYSLSDKKDPKGPATGEERVYRGGSFNQVEEDVRSGSRGHMPPRSGTFIVGMRLVRTRK